MRRSRAVRAGGALDFSGAPHRFAERAVRPPGPPPGQQLERPSVTAFTAYAGLFLISFLAATIFPAQSEIGLAALLLAGDYNVVALVVVASVGNTLGSMVNWLIGRWVEHFKHRRWFPAKPEQLDKAVSWYHRYGRWSLLLSWTPFIGDPLTLAAGVLREPLWSFVLIVGFAKTVRYVVVAALTLSGS